MRTLVFISLLILFLISVCPGAIAYYNYPYYSGSSSYYYPNYQGSYYNYPSYYSGSYYNPYYTGSSYYYPNYQGSYYDPYYGYNYGQTYAGYGNPGYGYGAGWGGCDMMANSAFQAYNDYATLSMIVNARLQMMYMLYGNLHVSGSLGNSAAILAQAYYF